MCANSDTKIIDYNALISEKIMKLQEAVEKEKAEGGDLEFVGGLSAETVEELLEDTSELEEKLEEKLQEAKEEAEAIVARANEDAAVIVARAKEEADIIRADNAEIGRKEGYEEGKKKADDEAAELRKAIEDEKLQMEIEYNQKLNEMEPMLVETILTVFERVTHVLSLDKKDLVLKLVNDVLSKTEISKEFLIRVSPEDYKFVIDNREHINGVVSHNVQIEIVEDPTFRKGQCMIESDSGIYDCSLDIQLENLIAAIKTMSCMAGD